VFTFRTVDESERDELSGIRNTKYDIAHDVLSHGNTLRVDGTTTSTLRAALKTRTARPVHINDHKDYLIVWYD
jgi:hypothetical protein